MCAYKSETAFKLEELLLRTSASGTTVSLIER